MVIAGSIFFAFTITYALLSAAVFYHLFQYTLPGWTAARIVVPIFLVLSAALFLLTVYFFFGTPWEYFDAS